VLKELLRDGRADPANLYNSPIRVACQYGNIKMVEALLQDKRVDPTDLDNLALRYASLYARTDVVSLLLQDGRVEPTDQIISEAPTDEIKEMLIAYKYRVDGKEYCKAMDSIKN
jgi:hypothetical protein